VPYHFVYDLSFPVLIQVYSGDEIFQFPVAVIIDKNVPREAKFFELDESRDFDLCKYKTQSLEVNLYNNNLNKVDGNISFSCFDQKCNLGESQSGKLQTTAPACLNGYLKVAASGYKEKSQLVSTNEESNIDVILDREYNVVLNVISQGKNLTSDVVAIFTDESGKSQSVLLPDVNNVKLSEGSYKIKVYAYSNTSITIPESKKTDCRDIPKSGILGVFGATHKQCFDITIPGTTIDYGLIGGGASEEYLLENDLQKGKM